MPESWDANDGQTHHLDEHGRTVGGMLGLPLVRDDLEQGAGLFRPHHSWSETAVLYDGVAPTHIAFPLDEASLAGMQERIARRIGFDLEAGVVEADECAWNIMTSLGLVTP